MVTFLSASGRLCTSRVAEISRRWRAPIFHDARCERHTASVRIAWVNCGRGGEAEEPLLRSLTRTVCQVGGPNGIRTRDRSTSHLVPDEPRDVRPVVEASVRNGDAGASPCPLHRASEDREGRADDVSDRDSSGTPAWTRRTWRSQQHQPSRFLIRTDPLSRESGEISRSAFCGVSAFDRRRTAAGDNEGG